MFTDGAATANGYLNCRAAWGVFFDDEDSRNCGMTIDRKPVSNQVAELMAISEALRLLAFSKLPAVIVTDSKYAIDCLTKWHKQWENNNWRTQKDEPVKHQHVIKDCLHSLKKFELECQRKVSFLHVNSHQKKPISGRASMSWILWYGNDSADKIARGALPNGRSVTITL